MTAVRLVNLFIVLAALALILGVFKMIEVSRARAMRLFAAKWGFRYVGPAVCRWSFSSQRRVKPPLPPSFPLVRYPLGRRITQVWNVVEGEQSGLPVLIFDAVVGTGRGSGYCTFIACPTDQNPFATDARTNRIVQSQGWTVLYGVQFLLFAWKMGVKRLDKYVDHLCVGGCAP